GTAPPKLPEVRSSTATELTHHTNFVSSPQDGVHRILHVTAEAADGETTWLAEVSPDGRGQAVEVLRQVVEQFVRILKRHFRRSPHLSVESSRRIDYCRQPIRGVLVGGNVTPSEELCSLFVNPRE